MKKKPNKGKYRVQATYCVIAPNGEAEDYFFGKMEAIEECERLNKELDKYYKGFRYKAKKKKEN